MPINEVTFAAIDFESAGVERGQTDVPIQVGMATLQNGKFNNLYRSYLATDRPVTWAASKVHGITTESLEGAPKMLDLWPDFQRILQGHAVVAHGAGTEKRFLRAFPMHGFSPWIDTLKVARACLPNLPKHNLRAACESVQVVEKIDKLCTDFPMITWHDALYDSVASLALLDRIIRVTGIGKEPLALLADPDLSGYYAQRERGS